MKKGIGRALSAVLSSTLALASIIFINSPARAYATSVTNGTGSSSSSFTAPTAPVNPSISNSQLFSFSYPGGIFEVGAPTQTSTTLQVNAYKGGALDSTFNSTGSLSFTSQLATTGRSSLSMTTYAGGTKWAILDLNSLMNTGYNYLYLGTFAAGYQSTITLPTTASNYTTCTNKLNTISNGKYTSYSGDFELIPNTGFSTPLLNIGCQAFVTNNGSGFTSKANFLVNYSGGTTLGTPATLTAFGGNLSAGPVSLLDTSTKKTITNFGVSVDPTATGTTIALTFLDAVASSTSYSNTTDYDSTAYTDYIITRVSATGNITQTTGAWTGLLAGTRTGTVFVPPLNSGTIYAFAHATDGTNVASKVLKIQAALSATPVNVSGVSITSMLNRMAPMISPGSTIKIASLNDGSPSYYYEINGLTGLVSQISTFTTSGGFSADSFYWAMVDYAYGAEFYARSSSTSIIRVVNQTAPTAPSAPTNLAPTLSNQAIYLSWSAPNSNGSPITSYSVQLTADNGNTYTLWSTSVASTETIITGLTNGVTYRMRVAATNAVGTSAWSMLSGAVIPRPVPERPTNLVASYLSSTSVTLTWDAPIDNGYAVSIYTIEKSADNGATWNSISTGGGFTGTSYVYYGLPTATTLVFRLQAGSSIGYSLFSSASNAYFVADIPSAPAAPSATTADSQSVLTWSAPNANGCAITAYKAEYSPNNGATWFPYSGTFAGTTATLVGLTNGLTYKFRVAAENCDGWGPFSPASASVTPSAVPSAPTGVTVAGGVGSQNFALSWNAVTSASAVTDYRIEYASSGAGPWTIFNDGVSTATSATVGPFTAGNTLVFRVSATNSIGTGSPSAVTASYVAAAVPAAPAAPTGTSTPGQATITWIPPVNANAANTGASLFYSTNGTTWLSYSGSVDTSGTIQITSLPGGQNYYFKVQASNYFGVGAQSASSAAVFVQAATAPAAISQVTVVTGSSAGTIDLAWTAPAANGSPITNYVIEYSNDGGLTWTVFPHPTSTNTLITVTGLTAGSAYQFRVNAVNAIGTGASMSQASTAVNAAAAAATQSSSAAEFLASLKTNPNINTSDGKFDLTGTNLDQIAQIFLNQVEAKITYRTAEIMTIALPAEVLGWVDVTFVMKGSIIRFDRFMYVAKSISGVTRIGLGYKTIGYPRGKAPLISTNTLKANAVVRFANVIPKAANAKQATCIGYVGKGMTAKESLARARDTCTLVSLRYPRIITKVAVSKSILRAHVLVLFNY